MGNLLAKTQELTPDADDAIDTLPLAKVFEGDINPPLRLQPEEPTTQEKNILVIGSAGSGRSTLINALFNLTRCKVKASSCLPTTIHVNGITGFRGNTKYNLIDTPSLDFVKSKCKIRGSTVQLSSECQVTSSDKHLYSQERIRGESMVIDQWTQLLHQKGFDCIDQVVVILAGRLERQDILHLQLLMEWLRHSDHPERFCFVYNRAEFVLQSLHDELLRAMKNTIGLNNDCQSSFLANGFSMQGGVDSRAQEKIDALAANILRNDTMYRQCIWSDEHNILP